MGNFDFSEIWHALPYLFEKGMTFTLALTFLAAVLGLALGTILAVMRLSPSKFIAAPTAVYVNLIRSVPLLLWIFWFYFLVPYLAAWVIGSPVPLQIGSFRSAVITFTLFEAAYFCEIMRAGIKAIPQGQVWAGLALGLSPRQTMASVVLPQAFRGMVPALLTKIIILFQDTSLVYVLSLTDFFGAATQLGERDGRQVELYIFVAVVYLVMCFSASRLVKGYERRIRAVH